MGLGGGGGGCRDWFGVVAAVEAARRLGEWEALVDCVRMGEMLRRACRRARAAHERQTKGVFIFAVGG